MFSFITISLVALGHPASTIERLGSWGSERNTYQQYSRDGNASSGGEVCTPGGAKKHVAIKWRLMPKGSA
jgi:hypothetical protein